jgi:hypothetical protein
MTIKLALDHCIGAVTLQMSFHIIVEYHFVTYDATYHLFFVLSVHFLYMLHALCFTFEKFYTEIVRALKDI